MEKLIINSNKNKKTKSVVWKPLMVNETIYNLIQEIADETKLTKGEITTRVLEFGLRYTQVVTVDDYEGA